MHKSFDGDFVYDNPMPPLYNQINILPIILTAWFLFA